MRQILPLLLSLFTLIGMWLAGNKDRRAWIVGLGNQFLWITFALMFKAWGLLPLSLALIVVYTRNLIRWSHLAKESNYSDI